MLLQGLLQALFPVPGLLQDPLGLAFGHRLAATGLLQGTFSG